MTIQIDEREMQAIEGSGYGLHGTIGGIPRKTYFTPDGRVIKAIPQIRGYIKRDKDGRIIEQGERDANLDKGWLTEMPKEKKLFCQSCDGWHDTKKEIAACRKKQEALIGKHFRKAKNEEQEKTQNLENEVAELKAMVAKLMEAQGGQVLQSADTK